MSISTCSICIHDIVGESSFTTNPCKHEFHRDCIQIWLNDNDNCPNCRIQIERDTNCPIVNHLREKRLIDKRLIIDLQHEVSRMFEQVGFLEAMSIFNIPWYTDKLMGITYAIVPQGLETLASLSSTQHTINNDSSIVLNRTDPRQMERS